MGFKGGFTHPVMRQQKRLVSFLPSATELVYALGAQDMLFGVTHECTYPPDAACKPRIVDAAIDLEGMDSRQINDAVASTGHDEMFVIDRDALSRAAPDLVITQNTCGVCAADADLIGRAVHSLDPVPAVYSMDPHRMDEIISGVTGFADVIGAGEEEGRRLRNELEHRVDAVRNTGFDHRPRVVAAEWTSPLFTAGHWVPDMIEIAGGRSVIGRAGDHSRQMHVDEVAAADPDVIIVMPCGFGLQRTVDEYGRFLGNDPAWCSLRAVREGRVFAVDAGSFFSKPNIRTVAGIEMLAGILHPDGSARHHQLHAACLSDGTAPNTRGKSGTPRSP